MFCPRCRQEYRREFTRCAACKTDLVEALPTRMNDEESAAFLRGDVLPLLQAIDMDGRKLDKSRLEQARDQLAGKLIRSVLVTESSRELFDPPPRVLPVLYSLFVERADVVIAGKILGLPREQVEEVLNPDLDEAEAVTARDLPGPSCCPACSSPITGQDTECPECGLNLAPDNLF
jgi:hypothetical protein